MMLSKFLMLSDNILAKKKTKKGQLGKSNEFDVTNTIPKRTHEVVKYSCEVR